MTDLQVSESSVFKIESVVNYSPTKKQNTKKDRRFLPYNNHLDPVRKAVKRRRKSHHTFNFDAGKVEYEHLTLPIMIFHVIFLLKSVKYEAAVSGSR